MFRRSENGASLNPEKSIPQDNQPAQQKPNNKKNWGLVRKLVTGAAILGTGAAAAEIYDNSHSSTETSGESTLTANQKLERRTIPEDEKMYVPHSAKIAKGPGNTISFTVQVQPGRQALKYSGSKMAPPTFEITASGIEAPTREEFLNDIIIYQVPVPLSDLPPGREGDTVEFDVGGEERVRVVAENGGSSFTVTWRIQDRSVPRSMDITGWRDGIAKVDVKKIQ